MSGPRAGRGRGSAWKHDTCEFRRMVRKRARHLAERAVQRVGRHRAQAALRVMQLPLRAAVRHVVSRLPRDPNLLVFGAALDRFADNPAYLFLYLSRASGPLRCVWITGSEDLVRRLRRHGLAAERRWSPRGLAVCAHAGWFVVGAYASDVNRWLHDGASLLNLWHGIPLKVIERDIKSGPISFRFRTQGLCSVTAAAYSDDLRRPDVLLSTSDYVARRCFTSAFDIDIESCLSVGYPRNDHFFETSDAPPSDLLISDLEAWRKLSKTTFVVGYFPTWRDDGSAFPGGTRVLEELAGIVGARGGLLVFKPHFNMAREASQSASMIVLHPNDDLSAYLHLCSAIITDYSSVAFDFMLLGRPILYYAPDLDEYCRGRGLYFSPAQMMPGPLLTSPEELYEAVKNLDLKETVDPRVDDLRSLLWGDYEGHAAASIKDFLESRNAAEN